MPSYICFNWLSASAVARVATMSMSFGSPIVKAVVPVVTDCPGFTSEMITPSMGANTRAWFS